MIDVTPPPDRGSARRRASDPAARPPANAAERAALWLQFALALSLEAAFLLAGWTLYKSLPYLPIEPWQKVAFQVGLALAFAVLGLRALRLWRRLRAPVTDATRPGDDPAAR